MTITLTRKEAQQVLDSLLDTMPFNEIEQRVHQAAIETLRTRLAQPEPEPVAWFMEGTFMDGASSFIQVCETDPEFYTPLYTAPPKKEWVGLTGADLIELIAFTSMSIEDAKSVEAKLKEKNT